jgi:hypothetical protein
MASAENAASKVKREVIVVATCCYYLRIFAMTPMILLQRPAVGCLRLIVDCPHLQSLREPSECSESCALIAEEEIVEMVFDHVVAARD